VAFYDRVFSSELIAVIHAASAQMGPFELTRQLLYFYMSQRGIFDDEMWECVHELSESSFSDANYSDRLDQLYEKYAPEFYSEDRAIDLRKEPERWNEADVAVTVADGLSYGLRDPVRYLPFHICYNAKDYQWGFDQIQETIENLAYASRFQHGLPPELVAEIDAATAKFGPLGFTKKFLFSHLLDHGIRSGEVWDCVAELSESSYRDSSYIGRLERLSEKYDEDYCSGIDYEPEQLKTLVARMSMIDGILRDLGSPIAELPYHACYAMLDSRWDFDKLLEKVKSLE
jgi:hypothetical protein